MPYTKEAIEFAANILIAAARDSGFTLEIETKSLKPFAMRNKIEIPIVTPMNIKPGETIEEANEPTSQYRALYSTDDEDMPPVLAYGVWAALRAIPTAKERETQKFLHPEQEYLKILKAAVTAIMVPVGTISFTSIDPALTEHIVDFYNKRWIEKNGPVLPSDNLEKLFEVQITDTVAEVNEVIDPDVVHFPLYDGYKMDLLPENSPSLEAYRLAGSYLIKSIADLGFAVKEQDAVTMKHYTADWEMIPGGGIISIYEIMDRNTKAPRQLAVRVATVNISFITGKCVTYILHPDVNLELLIMKFRIVRADAEPGIVNLPLNNGARASVLAASDGPDTDQCDSVIALNNLALINLSDGKPNKDFSLTVMKTHFGAEIEISANIHGNERLATVSVEFQTGRTIVRLAHAGVKLNHMFLQMTPLRENLNRRPKKAIQ